GYCFEVPAKESIGLTKPVALKAMGRFRHEAIAIHPSSGAVYLTEDRSDGCLYRFLPKTPGKLADGGRLQALKVTGRQAKSTRNWPNEERFPQNERLPVEWIDLEDVESPNDDLRLQAQKKGAIQFSRGEGMWYGSEDEVFEESIYFVCTDGGQNQNGQVFRYFPAENEGEGAGELELFLEPNDTALLTKGDNICLSPWGDLFICEDSKNHNHIRGVNQSGEMYTFARNVKDKSEFAGACISPDGKTMFVNIQTPGATYAITGPF
ncbi:MAG: DUF839 domain-containing protein, partial [Verrucomicrobiales bacterium]|nr:DUF839 domain-containing protein [Verrucomicrobiales bacterium]